MKVKIKRVDKELPIPKYKTGGAVAFDLSSRLDMVIKPRELAYIPLNVIIETPGGHMLALVPRSSTFKHTGLIMANSFGVVDLDYSGDADELMLQVYNITDSNAVIEKGQRVAQGFFVKITRDHDWNEVKSMKTPSRGGFGTTGK